MEGRTKGAEKVKDQFQAQYDWDSTSPSVAVIEALAALEGVNSFRLADEIDTTLYDHLDPEALNTLVRENNVTVTFSMDNYRIELEGDSLIITQG